MPTDQKEAPGRRTEKPPTPQEFERKFRDDIRVGFNWDRFLAEHWPIERVTIDSHDLLETCFTPWYVGKAADEVSFDDKDAVPMSLRDVPKAFEILSDERRADILKKVERFRDEGGTVRFAAPTYALPDGGYFVLDRNHRLAALAVGSSPFVVDLWNVRGPHEEECLLDLKHWLRRSDR